jgi:hypothetical protein
MAREYGVADDPSAVASAVGAEYREGLSVSAESGCLEGLSE